MFLSIVAIRLFCPLLYFCDIISVVHTPFTKFTHIFQATLMASIFFIPSFEFYETFP